uniref:Glycosyltransferase RgtA/B/C/D-like domain-containing protein n=1 Tax=uncultured Chloroflexota bacterium TaxID=166587 RepID=H5SCW4_9CHLR|nr:hypothetical protein HGMM_F11H08C10 [uncultured Chloroflexota bacterium]
MLFRGWETFKEGLPFSRLVLGVAAAGTAFFLVSALRPPMAVLWLLSWATAAGGIWLLLLPALRDANAFLIEERRGRWLLAWLLGSAAAFLSSGFLVNPYPHPLQRLFLAASLSLLWGAIAYYALGRLWRVLNWQGLLNLAILVLFLFGVFWIGQQHPILFDIEPFSLKGQQAALFFSGMFFAMPWLAALLYVLERNQLRWRNSPLIVFVEEHFFGLLLASLFFAIYLFLGSIFNHSLMSQNDDVLFDTDSRTWKLRLATDAWQDPYQRSVHPAVLLVLRLWVQTLVFLLNGKQVAAALFATAAAGATCVFLAWLFIKNASQDENYALTWASILGASAGHLIFGSLVETYIFLALLLLLFMVLLQKEHLPLRWLVVTGLLTFGITLTNIIQEMLALLAVRRDLRLAAKFTGLVLSLGVVLSLANNLIFAAANPLFFLPSAFESRHMFAINSERAKVLFKGFFLHSMIGPDPLIFPAPAEKGYPPAFRTYRPFLNQRAEYNPLSKVVAWIWLGVLLIGSLLFLRSRGKNFRFSIGFLLCLAFNFGLHLRYGREFLLYSPNWIYALVLFLALSWANLRRVWAQGALQGFLVLLLISNMHFLYLIIHTAAVLIQGGS